MMGPVIAFTAFSVLVSVGVVAATALPHLRKRSDGRPEPARHTSRTRRET